MALFGRLFGRGSKGQPLQPKLKVPYVRRRTRAALANIALDRTPDQPPFLVHPDGEHESARAAIQEALRRLYAREDWNAPITFNAMGQGPRPDSYNICVIEVRRGELHMGAPAVNVAPSLAASGLRREGVKADQSGSRVFLHEATHEQFGRFVDTLFRLQLGVRLIEIDDDYAFGAEWGTLADDPGLLAGPDKDSEVTVQDPIRRLVRGNDVCIASKRVTEDGMRVGYMVREESDDDVQWTFMSGTESEGDCEDGENFDLCPVDEIARIDPDVLPFLGAPLGAQFAREYADAPLKPVTD